MNIGIFVTREDIETWQELNKNPRFKGLASESCAVRNAIARTVDAEEVYVGYGQVEINGEAYNLPDSVIEKVKAIDAGHDVGEFYFEFEVNKWPL